MFLARRHRVLACGAKSLDFVVKQEPVLIERHAAIKLKRSDTKRI